MKYKGLITVSSFATIFFFLPSLAFKLWRFLMEAPWSQKSWIVYLVSGLMIIQVARARLKSRKKPFSPPSLEALTFLAKERLVKGELSIEEFRRIREELKQN